MTQKRNVLLAAAPLLLATATAQASPTDSEAWTICKAGIEARLGEEVRVDLKRIRARGSMIRVDTRVRGLEEGPARLECRLDRDGSIVALFDPNAPAGSEFAANP